MDLHSIQIKKWLSANVQVFVAPLMTVISDFLGQQTLIIRGAEDDSKEQQLTNTYKIGS
jgi:hypothetical protein